MNFSFPRITLTASDICFICIVNGGQPMECVVDMQGYGKDKIMIDGWIKDDKNGIRNALYEYLAIVLSRKGK